MELPVDDGRKGGTMPRITDRELEKLKEKLRVWKQAVEQVEQADIIITNSIASRNTWNDVRVKANNDIHAMLGMEPDFIDDPD